MIADTFTLEPIDWSNARDRDACIGVREEVFVVEQKLPFDGEVDDQDPLAEHVLARDLHGAAIGTGRLAPPRLEGAARIGRMAVLAAWRGKRVGEAMLHALLDRARARRYPTVELFSQTHAVPFYSRFGFAICADSFIECGIEHVPMRRDLELPPPAPQRNAGTAKSGAHATATREEAAAATLRLITAARRELCLCTRDLDPALLDTDAVLEALKRVAISGRGARIRVLVREPQRIVQNGHRLIALSQRLSTAFELRVPAEEDRYTPAVFALNDIGGYYYRAQPDRFEGEAADSAPGRHAQLLEYFDQVWERAEPSEELRRLDL